MESRSWLVYVALAGLSWGVYVPIIFYGGSELGGKPASRIMGILCVGGAYFVIGVLLPLFLFVSGQQKWSDVNLKANGLIFASLAGVAGAVGAICVIFATKSAIGAERAAGVPFGSYKMYIAPLIFGLAPVINTLVSIVWHPEPGNPLHFGFSVPNWKLVVGVVLVGIGAGLVLFSKEESEKAPKAASAASHVPNPAPPL